MWYDREFYPRSRPRQAKGGIKAQSKRGSFGESWWARRWIEVLESFPIGGRLQRGRSYARGGQVLSIDIAQGRVTAAVQGSQSKPYAITIRLKPLSAADWKKLAKELAEQAIFAAKLLAGEMPPDIEKVFDDAGLSLFPRQQSDLHTDCSCPDWSNPCKHVAAVYYLLGEEFDRDPFLLFKLRGMERKDLVKRIGESGAKPTSAPRRSTDKAAASSTSVEPLPADAARFWAGASLPQDFFDAVQPPPVDAALPKRLGRFPFWRGERPFLEALEPIYRAAGQRGLEVYVGARKGARD